MRLVHIAFPSWPAFEAELRQRLEAEPAESRRMVGVGATVWLPEVLWDDYKRLEAQLAQQGWTLGRVIGYLAVHGATALTEGAHGDA